MVPADSSKMTVLPLLGAVTDATFRPDPLSLSSTLIVKATSSLVLAASLIAVAACTAEGITRSCTRNRTISILARTHEYQSLFPTFHLFTKSPWSLMISQCQATFPSEYSSHFVSHCKSIRECYTLGPSQECYTSTHGFPRLRQNDGGAGRKDGDGKSPWIWIILWSFPGIEGSFHR